MPIRIKPVYDLGPCILDSASIQEMCALVGQSFNQAHYSAEDGIWEVFDEEAQAFLSAISDRKTLDTFKVKAENEIGIGEDGYDLNRRSLEMIFDQKQATLRFSAPFAQENWFEHFLFDLKKYIRPPKWQQLILAERGKGEDEPLPFTAVTRPFTGGLVEFLTLSAIRSARVRYCYIILRRTPPNAFIENIKANLVSNLIWVVIVFAAGILFTLLALWLYTRFGVNVHEWWTPPSIPTAAPTP